MRARLQMNSGGNRKKPLRPELRKTIQWYLTNESWIRGVVTGEYQNWIKLAVCEPMIMPEKN